MKSLLIITAFFLSVFVVNAQKQVDNFEELMEALNSGKNVRAVFHYKYCQLISDNEVQEKIPDAIGGMSIDVYEYFAEGAVRNKEAFVVTSTSKIIKNPMGEGYVYNYAKVKVKASNEVRITAVYLDPITFEEKMTENFFTEMNNSENKGGAFFYIED